MGEILSKWKVVMYFAKRAKERAEKFTLMFALRARKSVILKEN